MRDLAALASALDRARNHPFADGNQRSAWVLARQLLLLNAVTIGFTSEAAIRTVLQLAAGDLSEEALTKWFQARRA